MRLLLVANPVAGRRPVARVEAAVRRSLAARGIDATVDTALTAAPGDATALARAARDRYDIVAAVGGDGTVRDVAAGLRGGATPLAIIANGTANVLAADLGIPIKLQRAVALLHEGAYTVPLDLGEVNGMPFVLNVGIGYAARLIIGTPPVWKRRVSFLAYLPAAVLATFERDRAASHIAINGAERYGGPMQMALIANSGGIGGHAIQIAPGIRLDDGEFAVAVFAPRSPLGTLLAFSQLAMRRHEWVRGAHYWSGTEVTVTCDPPLPVQVDGDPAGTTPCTVRIIPAALRVIVPDSEPRHG